MPLAPLQEFHHDQSWPLPGVTVFMTANRVWGPLASLIAFAMPVAIAIGALYV